MLHSVRFLQSLLRARVGAFALHDCFAAIQAQQRHAFDTSGQVTKAHHAAKVHCFVNGLSIAVEGELFSRGVVLATTDDPNFALRAMHSVTHLWSPMVYSVNLRGAAVRKTQTVEHLLQAASMAVAENVLVAWPIRCFTRPPTEALVYMTAMLGLPIVGASIEEGDRARGAGHFDELLPRRDVLLTVGPRLSVTDALALRDAAHVKQQPPVRGGVSACYWKPARASSSSSNQ